MADALGVYGAGQESGENVDVGLGGGSAAGGVDARRVLTDNAWAYSKATWRSTCRELGISPRSTRFRRPQTNGKVERFHLTLLEEWAYQRPCTSEAQRQDAFPDWLDWYNHHRPHTGSAAALPPAALPTSRNITPRSSMGFIGPQAGLPPGILC